MSAFKVKNFKLPVLVLSLLLFNVGCLSTMRLTNALKNGDDEAVKSLINSGVDVNTRLINGFTPLGVASLENRPNLVKFLLEKNANVNIQDNYGDTPLYNAVEPANSVEIAEMLLKYGANPNIFRIRPPLLVACAYNNLEMVKLLVKYGADVNIKDPCNSTSQFAPRGMLSNLLLYCYNEK